MLRAPAVRTLPLRALVPKKKKVKLEKKVGGQRTFVAESNATVDPYWWCFSLLS